MRENLLPAIVGILIAIFILQVAPESALLSAILPMALGYMCANVLITIKNIWVVWRQS